MKREIILVQLKVNLKLGIIIIKVIRNSNRSFKYIWNLKDKEISLSNGALQKQVALYT